MNYPEEEGVRKLAFPYEKIVQEMVEEFGIKNSEMTMEQFDQVVSDVGRRLICTLTMMTKPGGGLGTERNSPTAFIISALTVAMMNALGVIQESNPNLIPMLLPAMLKDLVRASGGDVDIRQIPPPSTPGHRFPHLMN